jgi:NAD(P)-dependent dehydrogenase (short-subunit alcohol dehydrogenase family)
MGTSLEDRTVLVVGRGGGIAQAITMLARAEGARVVVAGRNKAALDAAYDHSGVIIETVDVTDDTSIAALADRVGSIDHLVSTVSARARGRLSELERDDLRLSFDTKVIGPTMLAKYFAPHLSSSGSIVLFSGVNAFKVNIGYLGVAITNGAVDFLTRSLALELGPIRVNSISPGVIDTGAWDSLGDDGKRGYFQHIERTNPARRIGTVDDVANAVLFAMTNTFVTGLTLRVDGGEPLT